MTHLTNKHDIYHVFKNKRAVEFLQPPLKFITDISYCFRNFADLTDFSSCICMRYKPDDKLFTFTTPSFN